MTWKIRTIQTNESKTRKTLHDTLTEKIKKECDNLNIKTTQMLVPVCLTTMVIWLLVSA